MELMLNDLLGLLEGEIGLYASMLLALQKEKKAIVDSNPTELNETSREKETLFLKIRILEEQRISLLEKLAQELGQPSQELTLSKLSQLVREPQATQLGDCHSTFLSLAQSIQEINQSNKTLLTHSLDLLKGSLSLLSDLLSPNPVYYRTGKMEAGDQSGRLLSGKV
jgi:flagellar biosynthesis/type III secretory pathway chaperone